MQRLLGGVKIFKILIFGLTLALVLAGCGGGGGDGEPEGVDPIPETTALPTAVTGLSDLVPDAGGPSSGYNVQTAGPFQPAISGPNGPIGTSISPVPQPIPEFGVFTIIDEDAAIRLGKALFWDVQVSSDGQMACASCHFHAGADNRKTNTVHPGEDGIFDLIDPISGLIGPGETLQSAFFTFSADTLGLSLPEPLELGVDDRIGSSGVLSQSFNLMPSDLTTAIEDCTPIIHNDDAQANFGTAHRLVTGRNAPTVQGAVFYLDNFWDGRASQDFNGQDPLGNSGSLVAGLSSLASQATGPPLSDVEMSCAGREWNGPNSIGDKMVLRTPLAFQLVDPTDSVLGPLSNAPGEGLTANFPDRDLTYADLIATAFGTNGLSDNAAVEFYIDNFSNIWGQALQAYQATLIPNRTPYDLGLLTANQMVGLTELRESRCLECHVEPEFSDATVRVINAKGGTDVQKQVETFVVVDNVRQIDPLTGDFETQIVAGGDQGFHNIGAAFTDDDRGRHDSPGGVYNSSQFNRGAFKTPGMRNLILTAPFMHNGSIATVDDMLEFYDGQNQVLNDEINLIAHDGVSGGRQAQVVDFLTNGLLDCRVVNELAPFDHPELVIPDGATLPAGGAAGNGVICP